MGRGGRRTKDTTIQLFQKKMSTLKYFNRNQKLKFNGLKMVFSDLIDTNTMLKQSYNLWTLYQFALQKYCRSMVYKVLCFPKQMKSIGKFSKKKRMISLVILSVFLPQLKRKDSAISLFEILLPPWCSYIYTYIWAILIFILVCGSVLDYCQGDYILLYIFIELLID